MIVYSYDANGEFIGTVALDESDRDPIMPNSFIIPGGCTIVAPPLAQEGYACVWGGKEWGLIKDHRGEEWWDADGRLVVIRKLGEVPDGLTQVRPPDPPPPPRVMHRYVFKQTALSLGVLDKLNAVVAKAKPKDVLYWNNKDFFPENNEKLARFATASGVNLAAIYDAALA